MGLSDYKITDSAIAQKGVVAAPDRLTGTAAQNKAVFDRLIREAVMELFNGLIDELSGTCGAADVGTAAIAGVAGGDVQAVLEGLKAYVDGHYVTAGKKAGTTLGDKTTAEGRDTTASGDYAHAEGDGAWATGSGAHAEGVGTRAARLAAHAEGAYAQANEPYAHAEGFRTEAGGMYAHAEGFDTVANHRSQHVFGEYNEPDASAADTWSRGNYVEVVGNGAGSSARSNARTLDWSGNETLAGRLTLGAAPTAGMDAATKQYVDTGLASKQGSLSFDLTPTAGSGNPVTSGGVKSYVDGRYVEAGRRADTTSGTKSTAEGEDTTASGDYAHAEGRNTTASGTKSHAEGGGSVATAEGAHAEGIVGQAYGMAAHAEGYSSRASGDYAHAEGDATTARGRASHAEGTGSVASRKSQHVFGEYNVADASSASETARGSYVEIVGNGTGNAARSNARTLDWSGNETLAGRLTLGAAPTANMDAATKQYVDDAVAGGLPAVTASDNGKVLTVVNGAWAAAALPVYNGQVVTN